MVDRCLGGVRPPQAKLHRLVTLKAPTGRQQRLETWHRDQQQEKEKGGWAIWRKEALKTRSV